MYLYKKHFTFDEARSFLPRIRFEVTEMIQKKKHLDRMGFNIITRRYRPGFNPDTLTEYPDEFIQIVDLIQGLQDDGIQVKSIDEGLIDFPSLRPNGEEVFLCWREGEKDIKYWHSLNGGFRGRRAIGEL